MSMRQRPPRRWKLASIALMAMSGCAGPTKTAPPLPSVAPTSQPSAALQVTGAADVRPMYSEMLAVDLPTVTRVVLAQSIEIQQARERVLASRGRYEGAVESLLPVIAPALTYQHLEGVNQNANGTLVSTNFNNLIPAVTLQWIVNPGRVFYDIVASKRRLEASAQQERATVLDTTRRAAIQYYDLLLAQARVAVSRKSAGEAEEGLRLTTARVRAGAALSSDEMRARAFLAGRRQDLLLAIHAFYQASVALTLTLHLDPLVTLVPATPDVAQTTLVRDDLGINQMLALAVQHRPDLAAARTLLAAAKADRKSVIWGALGPQLQGAYSYSAFSTRVNDDTIGPDEQQRASASAGFALGASAFGNVKTAGATLRSAALDVERQLDEVRSQVVSAQQASLTHGALIPIASEQVDAAEEALRLAQANVNQGTLLALDLLQAEDQVDSARLRYVDAVAHYNQSQVDLLAALGLLESERLAPTTAHVDQ